MSPLDLPGLETRKIAPFGVEVAAPADGADPAEVDLAAIRRLATRHRLVVLRGFAPTDKPAMEALARRFGDLLAWNFGYVLDLVVHETPANYLFTRGNVPYHWDGAFAEVVPSLQVFQCVEAPDAPGGETVFCDTPAVLDRAGAATRAAWQGLSAAYRTEKKAHYGGEIRQRLIDRHPVTGEPTIRFAEPLNEESVPLNPLDVALFRANGRRFGDAEAARFLEDFVPRLYAPEVTYAHRWRTGDYVVADNHALLHGRRPFFDATRRHLRRVHVV